MLTFDNGELGDGPWFAGDTFTAADVMMTFPFTTMRHFFDVDMSPYPNIVAYLRRSESGSAYREAMAIAGPNAH